MDSVSPVVNPDVLGVQVIGFGAGEFHISINVPTSAEIHFQNLEEALSSCKKNDVEKCFFHVVSEPCSRFIGKALIFYKDFHKDLQHEVFIVYYDKKVKHLLNMLRIDSIFNILSKEEFEGQRKAS